MKIRNPDRLYMFGWVIQIAGFAGGGAVAWLTKDPMSSVAGLLVVVWGVLTMILARLNTTVAILQQISSDVVARRSGDS